MLLLPLLKWVLPLLSAKKNMAQGWGSVAFYQMLVLNLNPFKGLIKPNSFYLPTFP